MSAPRSFPSRYVSGRTDVLKTAVAAALERQRQGIDGLSGLRHVAIRVRLATHGVGNGQPQVIVTLETEG